ncbi:MAG: ATP-dependent sacrificial sulfur transferase LarE [Planctomycetaceae bacterium]|nr:ATP-dependent sacrificial sulfur transferase LarE [Planctomycetaceae bacterium]
MSAALDNLERDLLDRLRGYGRVAVAFSAGVDSTVVAAAAQRACGDRAVAVTAVSPSLPAGELEDAEALARQIGIRHVILRTDEFSNPDYVRNPVNRCYFCKTELYSQMTAAAPSLGVDVLVNGANLDDQGDYRPGMQAAGEFQVRSPLIEAGFTKSDVRALAERWRLPNADKPAGPCLSSRLAYGVEVTPERLVRVDRAEQFLKRLLNVAELRVRCEAQELARLELPLAALPQALTLRAEIVTKLRALGFRAVTMDLEGFRSGSYGALVTLEVGGSAKPQASAVRPSAG